ncbi:hypothetical protein M0534_08470 [Methylonatrum kenyense]|uniref:hypothetical protein n=1 Tax=Methylonatrum kenyense TaxID=455253 RepID=UPI0020BDA2D6|nr:hypothetical protein [Methylonatrum kenyense]MCK8516358.1 hypothetical protein [Methylonatrum kenyense]
MYRVFLKALFTMHRDDPELNPLTRDVIEAAGMLNVSEFDFLEIAHMEWFGRMPDRKQVNRLFANHMLGGKPPFWVHSLAREIISLFESGKLDRSRFGVNSPPPPNLRDIGIGILQTALMLFVGYLVFVYMIEYTGP